jgi:hypothetical protein
MKKFLPILVFCALVFAAPMQAVGTDYEHAYPPSTEINYTEELTKIEKMNGGEFAGLRYDNGENGFHLLFEILGNGKLKEKQTAERLINSFLVNTAVPKK